MRACVRACQVKENKCVNPGLDPQGLCRLRNSVEHQHRHMDIQSYCLTACNKACSDSVTGSPVTHSHVAALCLCPLKDVTSASILATRLPSNVSDELERRRRSNFSEKPVTCFVFSSLAIHWIYLTKNFSHSVIFILLAKFLWIL